VPRFVLHEGGVVFANVDCADDNGRGMKGVSFLAIRGGGTLIIGKTSPKSKEAL
jgi:hypothetical protein